MIHISIDAENVLDAKYQLQELLGVNEARDAQEGGPLIQTPTQAEKLQPVVEKKTQLLPQNLQLPTEKSIKIPDMPTTTCYPSMEDCRAKLNELRAAKGPGAVRDILGGHDVKSFTELTPDTYATVIEEVNDAL